MKSKIHSILIYPLLLLFAYLLKGRKENYDNFICKNLDEYKNSELLEINKEKSKNSFFSEIKYFFDKQSPLYDKTLVNININLEESPEKKSLGIFDLSKKIDLYYSSSMLSTRITNDNIFINLTSQDKFLDELKLQNLLRYYLLVYASRKVDRLVLNKTFDKKTNDALTYLEEILNNSKIENFSKSGDLYVITCEKKKEKIDIIWSSSNREIELTEFNKVFDKFGVLQKGDIKISNSVIYAFHK